ncbi:xanthine dehydrogenase family protein subunit M [Nocardioides sp. AN3]
MRPAPFSLETPQTLTEAVALIGDQGDDALILAGGQSLMPMLNMRIARPDRLIDLGGIAELRSITASDDELVIGSMTRHEELETSQPIAQTLGLLGYAAGFVGQPQTRSRGTLGGSLALGSSFSELCVCLLALDGSVHVESTRGSRRIEGTELFSSYLETHLAEDEILTSVRYPTLARQVRWGFSELKFRGCDFPIVIAAAVLEMRGDLCTSARIAVGGASSTPIRVLDAETNLVGRPVDDEAIAHAAALSEAAAEPMHDLHAPADYRKRAAAIQVTSALRMAMNGRNSDEH